VESLSEYGHTQSCHIRRLSERLVEGSTWWCASSGPIVSADRNTEPGTVATTAREREVRGRMREQSTLALTTARSREGAWLAGQTPFARIAPDWQPGGEGAPQQ
jgi:hypothetical protein